MTNEIQGKIDQDPQFQAFIEECRAFLVETEFNMRIDRIKQKWDLGNMIVSEEDNFKRFGYGENIVEKLSQYFGISPASLWKIIQFRKMFPTWMEVEDRLPKGKAISWYLICRDILPKPKVGGVVEKAEAKKLEQEKLTECKHEKFKCMGCDEEFTLEELLKKNDTQAN